MNIYVDYDDCLCETARAFTVIAERLFGKTVPYETVLTIEAILGTVLTIDKRQASPAS